MKTKILMVCLGNICRSPLAEGILQSKVDSKNIFVDSAGTGGWHVGKKPDSRSISIAKKYGLDISRQSCRQFSMNDFDTFDFIYVMDKSNYKDLHEIAKNSMHLAKLQLLLSESSTAKLEVPDPYYDTDIGFEKVYHMIDEACTTIANKLENHTI